MGRRVKRNQGVKDNAPTPVKDGEPTTSDADTTKVAKRGSNDPEWYSRDPRLVLDGARIPFNIPFGSKLKIDEDVFGNISDYAKINVSARGSTPGICTLFVKPSIGNAFRKTDPVNICANALYTHVRYMNSGRKNYDPADLMFYTLTFAEIYSFIYWMQRVYNAAFMYSQRNYYIGREMLIAEGIDVDNIVQNLANFRYWINSVINKVSSFCLPGDIYIFKRRVFLYSNVYIENPYGNLKDQLYQLTPDGYFKFDYQSNGAGMLKYVRISRGNPLTLNSFITMFNDMFSNITGDEDFGLMSGDVLKAYQGNIIGLAPMGEEGVLIPQYDPYVLAQFKNANIMSSLLRNGFSSQTYTGPDGGLYTFGDIGQATNGLIISLEGLDMKVESTATGPYSSVMQAIQNNMRQVITVENPEPDVGDVLEATRLMTCASGFIRDQSDNLHPVRWEVLNAGTEIVVDCQFRMFIDNPTDGEKFESYNIEYNFMISSSANINHNIGASSLNLRNTYANMFKYMPRLYLAHFAEVTIGSIKEITMDACTIGSNTDNTTLVGPSEISRIHEIALLSLYFVPGVAKLLS